MFLLYSLCLGLGGIAVPLIVAGISLFVGRIRFDPPSARFSVLPFSVSNNES